MSAAAMPMSVKPATLPLFYHRVVALDPAQHGDLRLVQERDFGFAASADNISLAMGELEVAAQHYPILFTAGSEPRPVALLGLRQGENLFVMPDGSWRDRGYLPAYCRAYPFMFLRAGAGDTTYVGIEPDATCLRRDRGEPLFEDGKPTPVLDAAIAFGDEYRTAAKAATVFGQALAEQGVLEDEAVSVTFEDGTTVQVRGFQIIRPERLNNIADEVFLDWRRRGWLSAIYAHLYSLGRLSRLVELTPARSSETEL